MVWVCKRTLRESVSTAWSLRKDCSVTQSTHQKNSPHKASSNSEVSSSLEGNKKGKLIYQASEVLNHCAHTGIDHTPICNLQKQTIYIYKSENIHSQKQRLRFPTWIPLLALHWNSPQLSRLIHQCRGRRWSQEERISGTEIGEEFPARLTFFTHVRAKKIEFICKKDVTQFHTASFQHNVCLYHATSCNRFKVEAFYTCPSEALSFPAVRPSGFQ